MTFPLSEERSTLQSPSKKVADLSLSENDSGTQEDSRNNRIISSSNLSRTDLPLEKLSTDVEPIPPSSSASPSPSPKPMRETLREVQERIARQAQQQQQEECLGSVQVDAYMSVAAQALQSMRRKDSTLGIKPKADEQQK